MDEHFRTSKFEENIPVWLGLTSVWNVSFLGYAARAILPYCQALSKLAPHIQQVQGLAVLMPTAEPNPRLLPSLTRSGHKQASSSSSSQAVAQGAGV